MFIYNFKVNGGWLLRFIIIILSVFMLIVFGISLYKIFFTSGKFIVSDKIEAKEITEISPDNYSNILQAVHNDINSYLGMKIKFTGYVYRLLDFKDNQFVIARDMYINEAKTQTVVIGFLSEFNNAKDFQEGAWVNITGTIEKGKYHNEEIPIVKIEQMEGTEKPSNIFVDSPDNTYVQTSGLL
ncbi:MAG: hypothetical protein HFJ55_04135 [Clostridia bacterium]|nr:hypothetical protein [Clostridia bacterium]